jgi:predicted transposase YdaD
MAQYDEIVKHLMDRFADDFVMLSFATSDVEVLETLDTEQQTVKVHRNDMTFKVLWNNETVLLHIEVQTHDSRDKPMPLRVLSYAAELLLRYELPVYSVVFYLSANAGHTDPGGYSYGNDTFGLQHKYQVIRLADLEGESFLDTASVGLLPFTPLMRSPEGINTEAWLQKCVEKTESAPVDTQTRGTLLFALSTLGSLNYDASLFQKLISEEMMQESPFYELILQRGKELGIEQGSLENCIKNILSVLTERFPLSDTEPVAEILESIQDLDRLSKLLRMAVQTFSVETFLQEVETSAE